MKGQLRPGWLVSKRGGLYYVLGPDRQPGVPRVEVLHVVVSRRCKAGYMVSRQHLPAWGWRRLVATGRRVEAPPPTHRGRSTGDIVAEVMRRVEGV